MGELGLPKFDVPLFDNSYVLLCRNIEEWTLAHQHFGAKADKLDRCGAANTFRSLSGEKDVHLLAVFDRRFSTLAHESAHIVFDICHLAGVDVEAGKSNETFCYLLDKLFQFAEPYLKSQQ